MIEWSTLIFSRMSDVFETVLNVIKNEIWAERKKYRSFEAILFASQQSIVYFTNNIDWQEKYRFYYDIWSTEDVTAGIEHTSPEIYFLSNCFDVTLGNRYTT